jgi:hypothetical protein
MGLSALSGLSGISGITNGDFAPNDIPNLNFVYCPTLQRDRNLLFQDSDKTIPARNHGDLVRAWQCPYTGVSGTAPSDASSGLLYYESNGEWSITYNGVNTFYLVGITPSVLGNRYSICSKAFPSSWQGYRGIAGGHGGTGIGIVFGQYDSASPFELSFIHFGLPPTITHRLGETPWVNSWKSHTMTVTEDRNVLYRDGIEVVASTPTITTQATGLVEHTIILIGIFMVELPSMLCMPVT